MPTFCRPIEFSMPPGVSATRGWGLPRRGSMVTPLETMAPSALMSKCFANSKPQLKQPEAGITGLRRSRLFFFDGARSISRLDGMAVKCRSRSPLERTGFGRVRGKPGLRKVRVRLRAISPPAVPGAVEAEAVAIPHEVFCGVAEFAHNPAALAA